MMMTVETKFVVNPPFSFEITCTGLCPRLGFVEETFAVKSVWTQSTTVLVQPHSKSVLRLLILTKQTSNFNYTLLLA